MDAEVWADKVFTSPHEIRLGGIMVRLQGVSWQHYQGQLFEIKATPLPLPT